MKMIFGGKTVNICLPLIDYECSIRNQGGYHFFRNFAYDNDIYNLKKDSWGSKKPLQAHFERWGDACVIL